MKYKDPLTGYTAVSHAMDRGEFKPVYLLYGQEEHLKDALLKKMADNVLDEQDCFNFVKLDNCGSKKVVDEARTYPFGGGRKIVAVRGFDRFAKSDMEIMQQYVERYMNDRCILVLLAEKADRKRKIVKLILKKGEVVDCPVMKGGRLVSWVSKRARDTGISISREAAGFIAENFGPSLYQIENEICKVSLYYRNNTTAMLDLGDIAEVISGKGSYTVFNLLDELVAGNIERSLTIVENLTSSGQHPIMITAMIAREFRMLGRARELLSRRIPAREIALAVHKPVFLIEPFLRKIGRFTKKMIADATSLIADADFRLRKEPPTEVLEMLLINLCSLA